MLFKLSPLEACKRCGFRPKDHLDLDIHVYLSHSSEVAVEYVEDLRNLSPSVGCILWFKTGTNEQKVQKDYLAMLIKQVGERALAARSADESKEPYIPNHLGTLVMSSLTEAEFRLYLAGKNPIPPCPRLAKLDSASIALFLKERYNNEMVPEQKSYWESLGVTKETIANNRTLFKVLALVLFNRREFVNKEEEIIRALKDGPLNLEHVLAVDEQTLEKELSAIGLDRLEDPTWRGRISFARSLQIVAASLDSIASLRSEAKTSEDLRVLLSLLRNIQGFGDVLSAKFPKYIMREVGASNLPYSEYKEVAKSMTGELHNERWVRRLEEPLLGGRKGLTAEIWHALSDDPLSFDYFYHLDKDFCSKSRCEECRFGELS